jgi:hypothetical protein
LLPTISLPDDNAGKERVMNAVMKASLAFALLSLPTLALAEQADTSRRTHPTVRTEQPLAIDAAVRHDRIAHPVQLSRAGHATAPHHGRG